MCEVNRYLAYISGKLIAEPLLLHIQCVDLRVMDWFHYFMHEGTASFSSTLYCTYNTGGDGVHRGVDVCAQDGT